MDVEFGHWTLLKLCLQVMKLAILPFVADNSFRANYSRGLIVVFAQTSPSNVTTRLTLDEYRAMEQTSPERHEYRNGKSTEIRIFDDKRQVLEWAGVKTSDAN
jgi:hypothetical protein